MNPETVNQKCESAFPQWKSLGDAAISEGGLTMRDYFAAKAMQGFLADDEILADSTTASMWIVKTACASYEMADAMMKARES